jgi:hypothetical protein
MAITITAEGPYQLIYNDRCLILLHESIGITTTQENIFCGTKEECEAKIQELNLPWAWELDEEM